MVRDVGLAEELARDLLEKLGRREEALVEWERAASLTHNSRERKLLLARAAANQPGHELPKS